MIAGRDAWPDATQPTMKLAASSEYSSMSSNVFKLMTGMRAVHLRHECNMRGSHLCHPHILTTQPPPSSSPCLSTSAGNGTASAGPATPAGPALVTGRATSTPVLISADGQAPASMGKQVSMPFLPRSRDDPSRAICPGNPPYDVVPASSTICRTSGGCTAWFVSTTASGCQLPEGVFAMVTAAHCITDGPRYTIDPQNPGGYAESVSKRGMATRGTSERTSLVS